MRVGTETQHVAIERVPVLKHCPGSISQTKLEVHHSMCLKQTETKHLQFPSPQASVSSCTLANDGNQLELTGCLAAVKLAETRF